MPKEVTYIDPKIKIGQGKFGPVNLIIYKGDLSALKVIPKKSIDKPKRIEHIQNEKKVLHLLQKPDSLEPLNFIVQLVETFTDRENVNFIFEYLPGQDLFWILQNEHNLALGKSG